MTGDEVAQLGPIRPEHATGGWRLEGDHLGRWRLAKQFGDTKVLIVPVASGAIAWTILRDGHVVRAASERDVETAKSRGAEWIAKQR